MTSFIYVQRSKANSYYEYYCAVKYIYGFIFVCVVLIY